MSKTRKKIAEKNANFQLFIILYLAFTNIVFDISSSNNFNVEIIINILINFQFLSNFFIFS